MSLAIMNDTTKVDDQERICRELAERRGWKVAEPVYSDNNRSAWQRNRKRPAWDQMLRDVEAGKINAIVVYHGDRLIRQPWDLERLINLAYGKGVKLASPTGDRDLSKSDDLYIVRIEAAGQCRESDRTSERRKSQYARWRREGRVRPGGRGGRAYGFATDGVTQVEAECNHVRDMAAMLLAGEPTGALVRDAAARGALTPAGSPFTHGTIRKMLARPRYAGLMPDGESAAAWEPVLGRRDWERACEILAAKTATFAYATNARRWLLSGIAVCGACEAPVQIRPSKGRGRQQHENGYGCNRAGCRKVYRSAPLLDAYVGRMTVNQLNHPLAPEAEAPAAPDSAAEWAALAREQAETQRVAASYTASAGRLSLLMARLDAIDARMAELRERESGSTRSRLLETYRGTTWEQWPDLPLEVRRALVSAHFKVTVLPASKRGPGFRTEDVRLEPLG
jgi:DNA invertase Pin-like site-specific DNA recombinase